MKYTTTHMNAAMLLDLIVARANGVAKGVDPRYLHAITTIAYVPTVPERPFEVVVRHAEIATELDNE